MRILCLLVTKLLSLGYSTNCSGHTHPCLQVTYINSYSYISARVTGSYFIFQQLPVVGQRLSLTQFFFKTRSPITANHTQRVLVRNDAMAEAVDDLCLVLFDGGGVHTQERKRIIQWKCEEAMSGELSWTRHATVTSFSQSRGGGGVWQLHQQQQQQQQ